MSFKEKADRLADVYAFGDQFWKDLNHMFSYIKGELAEAQADSIVVEAAGIGYGIAVPGTLLDSLPPLGTQVKVYTHLYVKDDLVALYGFFTREDLRIFRLLLGVSGIGPKGALGILSAISTDELRFAVLSGDVKSISRAPGIGTKTAQRLIIELKDKLDIQEAFESRAARTTGGGVVKQAAGGDQRGEAVQALAALGYSLSDATRAVRKVEHGKEMSAEDIIKEALKNLL